MAPEQFDKPTGERRLYTTHTDVWSFGVLVWEIFSKGTCVTQTNAIFNKRQQSIDELLKVKYYLFALQKSIQMTRTCLSHRSHALPSASSCQGNEDGREGRLPHGETG